MNKIQHIKIYVMSKAVLQRKLIASNPYRKNIKKLEKGEQNKLKQKEGNHKHKSRCPCN